MQSNLINNNYDDVLSVMASQSTGINEQIRDLITGSNSGQTGAGQNQSVFATTTIINSDFPTSQFPIGADQSKVMYLYSPNAVQSSIGMFVFRTAPAAPFWYFYQPVKESKNLGDTSNYAGVCKTTQVLQIYGSNSDLNQTNFSGTNTTVSVDRIPADFNTITSSTITNTAVSGTPSIQNDVVWNKMTLMMEPNLTSQLNPKANLDFVGGLCKTGISQEKAVTAQFYVATDPEYFNKTGGILFDLDLITNDKVIFPSLNNPFSITFSLNYTSNLITPNNLFVRAYYKYIDAGVFKEFEEFTVAGTLTLNATTSYAVQTPVCIIPKGVITRLVLIAQGSNSAVTNGHVSISQLNDNVGSLKSQTVMCLLDGLAQFTVVSLRGSSGYICSAAPNSITLMNNLLKQPTPEDLTDWVASIRLLELATNALNCNYIFTQQQFADLFSMMMNTQNRQHHYGVLAADNFSRLKTFGRMIMPYLKKAGKAAYRMTEKRVPMLREFREEYTGAPEQFPIVQIKDIMARYPEVQIPKGQLGNLNANILAAFQAMELTEAVFGDYRKQPRVVYKINRFIPDSDDEGYIFEQKMSVEWRPAKKRNKHGHLNPHYVIPSAFDLTIGDIDHTMESKDFLVGVETNPGPTYGLTTLQKVLNNVVQRVQFNNKEVSVLTEKSKNVVHGLNAKITQLEEQVSNLQSRLVQVESNVPDHKYITMEEYMKLIRTTDEERDQMRASFKAAYDVREQEFSYQMSNEKADAFQYRQDTSTFLADSNELAEKQNAQLVKLRNKIDKLKKQPVSNDILDSLEEALLRIDGQIHDLLRQNQRFVNQITTALLEVVPADEQADLTQVDLTENLQQALYNIQLLNEDEALGESLDPSHPLTAMTRLLAMVKSLRPEESYAPNNSVSEVLSQLVYDEKAQRLGLIEEEKISDGPPVGLSFGFSTKAPPKLQFKTSVNQTQVIDPTPPIIPLKSPSTVMGSTQGNPDEQVQSRIEYQAQLAKEAKKKKPNLFVAYQQAQTQVDTPRYQADTPIGEEEEDDFGEDNPDVDENVEIDNVAPELITSAIKFESVNDIYGKFAHYSGKKPVECNALFGTVLPTAFSINNGSAGMFATVTKNNKQNVGGMAWLQVYFGNKILAADVCKLTLKGSEITRLMGFAIQKFGVDKEFVLNVTNISELNGDKLSHSTMLVIAQCALANMWSSGQISTQLSLHSSIPVAGASWMACMSAILQRKDTRFIWTGGQKYNPKDGTLSPNSKYDSVNDMAKIKYFLAAGKNIDFPKGVGILEPVTRVMLDVSYDEWYLSHIEQHKGVATYYDTLKKRMVLKLVMFRLSANTSIEMDLIEKMGVSVGGFGDTSLPILFFASQQHFMSQALNATRVTYVAQAQKTIDTQAKQATKLKKLGTQDPKTYVKQLNAAIMQYKLDIGKKLEQFPIILSLDDMLPPAVYVPAGFEWVFNKVYQESLPGKDLPDHVRKVLTALRSAEPVDKKGFKGLESVYQGMRDWELKAVKEIFEGYEKNNLQKFQNGSKLKSGQKNEVDPALTKINSPEGAAVIATALAKIKQQINTILIPKGSKLTDSEPFLSMQETQGGYAVPASVLTQFIQLESPGTRKDKNPEARKQSRFQAQDVQYGDGEEEPDSDADLE